METRLDPVYRKSERGAEEVRTRAAGLPSRARAVLILVNGLDSASVLLHKLGPDALAILQDLLAQGHIEVVAQKSSPPAPARTPGAPATTTPVSAASDNAFASTQPPTPSQAEIDALLAPLRRQALQRLVEHFGPDTPVVAAALLSARTITTYCTALDGLEAKMQINLGRKMAAQVLAGLRPDVPSP
jgi:hypothetical protein